MLHAQTLELKSCADDYIWVPGQMADIAVLSCRSWTMQRYRASGGCGPTQRTS